jgi:serine protease Do
MTTGSQFKANSTQDNRIPKYSIRTVTTAMITGLVIMLGSASLFAKTNPVSSLVDEINVNDGFSSLVKAVKPAVVNISTTNRPKAASNTPRYGNRQNPDLDEFMRRFFGDQYGPNSPSPKTRETHALGSGFIVSEDGIVVTNHHVIDDADEIEVVFQDGKRYPATLKGSDKKTDIAVLQINADHPLPYTDFGNSDDAEVGDWVMAIGNPFGLGGTVTAGIISARGRDIRSGPYDDFIQIDAPINRGNSGGPLFNTQGQVIGVNSAIYSPSGGSVGIGFSIPANLVKNIVSQLTDNGVVERGWLGVHIATVSEEIANSLGLDDAYGALIRSVLEDSPAELSGLEAGDVITHYNGERLDEMRDLPRLVANTLNGDTVSLSVWRNDAAQTISAIIGDSKSQPGVAQAAEKASMEETLGLVFSELNDELRKQYSVNKETQGVVITDIDPDSAAAVRGVQVGDVVKKIGRTKVATPDEAIKAVEAAQDEDKTSILLLIERERQILFVAVPIA